MSSFLVCSCRPIYHSSFWGFWNILLPRRSYSNRWEYRLRLLEEHRRLLSWVGWDLQPQIGKWKAGKTTRFLSVTNWCLIWGIRGNSRFLGWRFDQVWSLLGSLVVRKPQSTSTLSSQNTNTYALPHYSSAIHPTPPSAMENRPIFWLPFPSPIPVLFSSLNSVFPSKHLFSNVP